MKRQPRSATTLKKWRGEESPSVLRRRGCQLVAQRHPQAKKIKVVQDNPNTHVKASLYQAFTPVEARRILDKLEFHYTPKHGSWLNRAEIELSVLSRQCRLFWFLCGNEVYTDSFFHKIVLKVLPSKHFTLHKQKLSHKVEKSRLFLFASL